MPNYPTHARWGRIGAVVIALAVGVAIFILFESPFLAVAATLAAAPATFVGAIFPDVDHHNSIPRRKAVRGLSLLAVLGVASLVALNFELLVGFTETGVQQLTDDPPFPPEVVVAAGTALVAFAAAGAVDPAIGIVTRRHRAWTHSVPITFALTAVLVVGVWVLTAGLETSHRVAAIAVVWTFFGGILIHLGLDGEIL